VLSSNPSPTSGNESVHAQFNVFKLGNFTSCAFSENFKEPFKVPCGVEDALMDFPFHVRRLIEEGARTSRVVVALISPRKASVEPEIEAPRTRYGPATNIDATSGETSYFAFVSTFGFQNVRAVILSATMILIEPALMNVSVEPVEGSVPEMRRDELVSLAVIEGEPLVVSLVEAGTPGMRASMDWEGRA